MSTINDKSTSAVPGAGPGGKDLHHEHAWKGVWSRPVLVDERTHDPFTIARMTDHNVRASDDPRSDFDPSAPRLKLNVGGREQYLRIGIGVILIFSSILVPLDLVLRIVLGAIGLTVLATGMTRYSPLNQALGINRYGGENPLELGHAEDEEEPPKSKVA